MANAALPPLITAFELEYQVPLYVTEASVCSTRTVVPGVVVPVVLVPDVLPELVLPVVPDKSMMNVSMRVLQPNAVSGPSVPSQ